MLQSCNPFQPDQSNLFEKMGHFMENKYLNNGNDYSRLSEISSEETYIREQQNQVQKMSLEGEIKKNIFNPFENKNNYWNGQIDLKKSNSIEYGDRFIHNRSKTHTEINKYILNNGSQQMLQMYQQKQKQNILQSRDFNLQNMNADSYSYSNQDYLNGQQQFSRQNSTNDDSNQYNNNNNTNNTSNNQMNMGNNQEQNEQQQNQNSQFNNNNNNNSQQNNEKTIQERKKYYQILSKAILGSDNQENIEPQNQKIGSYNELKRTSSLNYSTNQPTFADKLTKIFSTGSEARTNKKQYRKICSSPEKILDAPELRDDYYLNLMNWGDNGILAVCLGQSVYLWNSYNGQIDLLLTANDDTYITSVAWMKNRNVLAVGLSNSTIQIWDTEKCMPYRNLFGHECRVSSLAWNNWILSSGSRDTKIINHDVRVQQNIVNTYQAHTQEVCGLKWNPSGTKLASGSNDNNLYIWDYSSSQIRHHFTEHTAAVKALAWCPWQSDLLASGGGTKDKTMKFWDTLNGELIKSVDTQSQVCSIVWNPWDRELVSSHGYSRNQLTVWNYNDMEKIAELQGHQNRVLHMELNPEGTIICSGGSDETLRFWNVFEQNSYSNKMKGDGYSDNLSIYSNGISTALR